MTDIKFAVSAADTAPQTAPIPLKGKMEDNLMYASSLGYDAIEIHMRENEPVDIAGITRICKENGIGISAIVTGRLATQEQVSLTDFSTAKRAVNGLRKYIEIAHEMDTDVIIGWIRGKIADVGSQSEYEKILAGNIRDLARYAKQKNVRLLIEAINRYEIDSFHTAEQILSFISRFELENVFVHLDTFHMNIEEQDIAKAVLSCGDRLAYIHFADSNRRYPGAGHLDFAEVIHGLDSIGYKGYISIECLPLPDGQTAAKESLAFLKNRVINNSLYINK